jgi:tetratricopeptide (TPR) repeat protein
VALVAAAHICVAQVRVPQDTRRQQALLLEQQGKNQEAESAWTAIAKAHPGDPEPLAHLGLLEARQGRFQQAIPLYRKALTINPNISGLRFNMALAMFKAGELKAAIPEFEAVHKKVAPNSPEASRCAVLIGMSYYGLAEYAKAAPYLKEATGQNPNSLPLLLALAHSYLWSRQFKEVLDVYHKILVINPDSAEADMLAGEALDGLKDNEGSTKMFRAAALANPKEPNVHFCLGYLLWTQKQYPEASREFQAELANDPQHAQSMLYLGDADIQMNQFEAARPLLEKVIQVDPSLSLAHLDLGIVYAESEHNQEALREFLVAAKKMPDDVNVHWRLARLYRAMGRGEEAKAEFQKASTLNKQADEALYEKIKNGAKRLAPPQQAAPAPQSEN